VVAEYHHHATCSTFVLCLCVYANFLCIVCYKMFKKIKYYYIGGASSSSYYYYY